MSSASLFAASGQLRLARAVVLFVFIVCVDYAVLELVLLLLDLPLELVQERMFLLLLPLLLVVIKAVFEGPKRGKRSGEGLLRDGKKVLIGC